MLANTLIISASDGTKMQSLHYKNGKYTKRIIIHVHGMAGNFYENAFMEAIALQSKTIGVDYFCFNNRGHDYIADCEQVNNGKTEFYSGGCAYEIFRDCVYDIEGAILWAIENKYSEIFLEGHSSGANKIIYAFSKLDLNDSIKEKIKGIILISPCDDVGIYNAETDESARIESFKMAQSFIRNGEPDKLMPLGTFFDYLLSAKTFMECFKEDSPLDMFPYRRGNIQDKEISKIKLPIYITFGDDGDFVLQDFNKIKEMYSKCVNGHYEIEIINGANHSYKNCEDELSKGIINWIKRNFG